MYTYFPKKAVLTIALLVTGVTAQAYEVITVADGGTISGTIGFSGTPPENPVLKITKDRDFCGQSITADYVLVGPGGGLKNAVVVLEGIEKGKGFDKNAVVPFDNDKCMFDPHVAVGVVGQKLGINNSDPILHNTHLYQGPRERTLYNLALPLQNKVIKKPLKRPGNVTVKCDAHEWMLGYVYVAEHPYAAVTAADGSFTLNDVPPGRYKVKIWHETLGEVTQEVAVEAGATARVEHTFTQ